jgi:hypothetical protein
MPAEWWRTALSSSRVGVVGGFDLRPGIVRQVHRLAFRADLDFRGSRRPIAHAGQEKRKRTQNEEPRPGEGRGWDETAAPARVLAMANLSSPLRDTRGRLPPMMAERA